MALGDGPIAQQVCVVLSTAERVQLAAIVADRNRPRKHVERAQIVLASADRRAAQQVAHSIGVSRPTVWRWQQRFAESGVEGLLRTGPASPARRRSREMSEEYAHPGDRCIAGTEASARLCLR
jgi:predicted alpha/beta hydrolase family esterase